MSHLSVMVLFAACVSAVFGALFRDLAREQFRLGLRIFLTLVIGAYVTGWLMFFAF